MLTIRRQFNQFKINVNDLPLGLYSLIAKNVNEVKHVIEHYYGDYPRHVNGMSTCPSCRKAAQEVKKLAKANKEGR